MKCSNRVLWICLAGWNLHWGEKIQRSCGFMQTVLEYRIAAAIIDETPSFSYNPNNVNND